MMSRQQIISLFESWRWFLAGALVVLMCALFMGRVFLSPGLVRSHDMEVHASRVANYYLAVKQGQFPPRWAPNTNFGFGMPAFIFTYPYPHAMSVLFFMVTKNIELGINLFVASSVISAALGMYLFSYLKTKKTVWSVLVALAYISVPPFLVNLFVRGAMGEVGFLGLVPWVMIAILKKEQLSTWWKWGLATLVFFFFMVSHPLSLQLFVPLLIGWYFLEHKVEFSVSGLWQHFISPLALAVLSAALLSMFFWIPFLVEKPLIQIEGNTSLDLYYRGFVSVPKLVWSKWGYDSLGGGPDVPFSRMIGPTGIVVALVSAWLVIYGLVQTKRTKEGLSQMRVLFYWLGVFVVTVVLILQISQPVWELFSFLKFQQFPWRLLWLTTVLAPLMLIELITIPKFVEKVIPKIALAGWVVFWTGYAFVFWAKPVSKFTSTNYAWFEFPETGMFFDELLPKHFEDHTNLRLVDKVVVRNAGEKVFDRSDQDKPTNAGEFTELSWNGTRMKYIVTATTSAEVVQKTANYQGWKVRVDGNETPSTMTDKEFPGRLIFPITAGTHTVEVAFTEEYWPRQLGNILSITGGVMASVVLGWLIKKEV
jgi:hypothetical protein